MAHSHEVDEPRWHAALGVVVALALYITLPPKFTVGPYWLAPLLVFGLLVPLLLLAPHRQKETAWQRAASIAHIAILNVFNVATLVLLLVHLVNNSGHKFSGLELVLAAVQIWCTNLIVYALWYWEVDGGGPGPRAHNTFEQAHARADFLFPQMALGADAQKAYGFRPRFLDYLYLSFNTAAAFSPTDTFALTPVAKLLMMGEGIISLITIAVIAGRAVNILS
ncbi:MAG: hypothetical protein M3Z07_03335 [Candidatus Eremiobacteraeota bacterium]|nr:hypothetical protein [Candidatus Eremiobacteraeota bacterium]